MGKSKLQLDTRRALKDGSYPIKIKVGHGTNLYIKTDISSTVEDWDSTTSMFLGKSAKRVNGALETMLRTVSNRILELNENGLWKKLKPSQIRQMLTNLQLSAPTVGVPTLGEVFKKVIAEKERKSTRSSFENALAHINTYCKDADNVFFDEINRTWLDGFYHSMTSLSVNSKAVYMRDLRTIVNYAIDNGITNNYPFRGYTIRLEDTRMRVLPVEKLRELMNLRLQGLNPEYRDMFMLTFYLIGINTIDLSRLTVDSIKDGRVEYRRAKTGKLYSILLQPEAKEIIKKYLGKKHLLRCFDRYKDYKAWQGSINNALGKIGPPLIGKDGKETCTGNHRFIMNPLEKDLTLYWARYSWATYAANLDISKDTISEALGHSHGARVTGIYIKYSHDKVDAANRKVINYVLGRVEK